MELKSLKIDRKEKEKQLEATPCPDSEYPYGMRLHLDTEALEKLGISELPEVGTELMLMAKVVVQDVHSSDSAHGSNRSIGIQLTDAALEKPKKASKASEEIFYGKSDGGA